MSPTIRVTKRDGSLVPYDGAEVAVSIADAARGLEDEVARAVQLQSDVEIALFDGITTAQLDEAIIQVALGNVKDDPVYDTIAARLLVKQLYKQVFGDTSDLFGDGSPDTIRLLHLQQFPHAIERGVHAGQLDTRFLELFDLDVLARALDPSRDDLLRFIGVQTMRNRYLLADEHAREVEVPQFFWMRVAMGLSLNEPDPTAFALDLYEQAVANTWFPNEIQLDEDLADFAHMTDDERHALTYLMSYFNPNELLVNKALAFGVYPYANAAECHLYLAKQMWEEVNHCMSFEYVLETFPIDRDEAYRSHVEVPSIAAKEAFENHYIKRMTQETLDISTIEGKQDFVRNLVAYNVILEGIWFYSGFMVALSFRQRNLLRNFGSLIDWIVRDESLHLKFGINLILTVLDEHPEILTEEFVAEIRQMIVDAVEMEETYNRDLLPKGIVGVTPGIVNDHVKYLTDRRLEELGFEPEFHVANPAKWMAAANDTLQLVNFFEATNTSYEVNTRAGS